MAQARRARVAVTPGNAVAVAGRCDPPAVRLPGPDDMTIVYRRYMDELVEGRFRDETRTEFRAVMRRMQDDEGIEAVILGGTEIPLLLPEPEYDGLAMLDTVGIHVDAAVSAMLGGAAGK